MQNYIPIADSSDPLKRVSVLDGWCKRLEPIAQDMRRRNELVLADHLDSVVDDLLYQQAVLFETVGPVVEFKREGQ